MINILIASYGFSGKGVTYEEICMLLDHQFASRTTVLNILDEGVKGEFLTKEIDDNDHRKQNYRLNIQSEKIISEWLDQHPFIEKI